MDDKDRREVATVLHGQRRALDQLKERARRLGDDQEMDELVTRSLARLGKEDVEVQAVEPVLVTVPAARPWEELVRSHEVALTKDGVDTSTLTVDQLLTPELSAEIDKEWAIWPEREKWRWWEDYVVVGAAGLAGGLLDLFISNKLRLGTAGGAHDQILRDGNREFSERFGDEIKNPMGRHPIDAKVPSDLLGGPQNLHRGAGPTHDLCRKREALDLMMGKQTDFSVGGQSVAEKTGGLLRMIGDKGESARIFNTFSDPEQAAFALKVHWLADFFSSRGLPLPGTSWLLDAGGGAAKFAMALYKSGFNLRNVLGGLGKLSGVVITELILRLHILIQRYRDGETPYWSFSAKRRYLEMFLVAHSLAAGIGAIAAVATWNPMMLNFGAIIAAVKNAIHLAWRVYKERREALDRFANLAERTSGDLDELLVRATAREVSLLVA